MGCWSPRLENINARVAFLRLTRFLAPVLILGPNRIGGYRRIRPLSTTPETWPQCLCVTGKIHTHVVLVRQG